MNAYDAYITRCKAHKSPSAVRNIIKYIIISAQRGYTNTEAVTKLNEHKIFTLTGKQWTVFSLAMQVLKMTRFEPDSSLAYEFAKMMRSGEVSEETLTLLKSRTRQ